MLPNPITGYINIVHFVPFYFSFGTLLSTFFVPWKRLQWKRRSRALILSDILFITISNIFSRLIGMFLRTIVIALGLFMLVPAAIFGLPLALIAFVITTDSFIFDRSRWRYMRPLAWDWHYGYTPLTDNFATELYYEILKYPIRGRKDEEQTIERILSHDTEKNILLVGEPGSGRRALLTFLSHRYVRHRFLVFNVVGFLKDKKTAQESAGALEEVLEECQSAGNVILIIHGLQQITQYATILERFISHEEFHLLGTTTPSHYHETLLPNKSLMKHFETLEIDLLDGIEIQRILADHAKGTTYSGMFDTKSLSALSAASNRLEALEHKYQPEAAIDLFEDFVSYLNGKDKKIDEEKMSSYVDWFLEERFHVPIGNLTKKDKYKLKHLEEQIHERVVNQELAVKALSAAMRRRHLQLTDEKRPIGSFLFLGPTGVGKTETAKALSAIFFEDEKKLIRFDMAQYQNADELTRLTQELAKAIREEPYGVLLLDELEKADHGILNLFLTILDEGYFREKEGSKIDCSSLIIIATSNAASEYIREQLQNDVHISEAFQTSVTNYVLEQAIFTPEFINRFDAVSVFTPLSESHIKQIANIKLGVLNHKLQKKHGKSITITDDLLENIAKEGVNKEFGAREIDRTINKLVADPLAISLLE